MLIFEYCTVQYPRASFGSRANDVDEKCNDYMIPSAPDGSWMYIMTRKQSVPAKSLDVHMDYVKKLGFKEKDIKVFPQQGEYQAEHVVKDEK